MAEPHEYLQAHDEQVSRSGRWSDVLRSNLTEGGTFVPSRSQTPVRDVYLGSDSEGQVAFKDTLRPNIRRGGTFVGSHLQMAEPHEYLQAHDEQVSRSGRWSDVLRSNLTEGGTFVPSRSQTPVRDEYLGSDSEGRWLG